MTDALTIIDKVLVTASRPCVTASFQSDCVALVHMLHQRLPQIPVLFIDTAHHFHETLIYRDTLASEWKLNLINVSATIPQLGLWQSSVESCCAHHKIGPLFGALRNYDTWFTALRKEQSPSRANIEHIAPFHLATGETITKVSPLADWTTKEVELYAHINSIPLLPLYERGYTSIGCEPCTQLPTDASNPRSGRWQGRKLECGIHLEPDQT